MIKIKYFTEESNNTQNMSRGDFGSSRPGGGLNSGEEHTVYYCCLSW